MLLETSVEWHASAIQAINYLSKKNSTLQILSMTAQGPNIQSSRQRDNLKGPLALLPPSYYHLVPPNLLVL